MNAKVIRVSTTEYETEDGEIHELPFELDEAPTVEQFQRTLDTWRELIERGLNGEPTDPEPSGSKAKRLQTHPKKLG